MSPISRAVLRAQAAAGLATIALVAAVQFGPLAFAATLAAVWVANTWLMVRTVRRAEADQRREADR